MDGTGNKPHFVRVIPAAAKDGSIDWTLCHNGPSEPEVCGQEPFYPVIELKPNSGYHFHVDIDDKDNLGVTFSGDPLWIQANTKPTQHVIDAQIRDVTPGSTTLKFFDRNKGDPVDLVYQLNFVGRDKQPVESIDPTIKNGGTTFVGYDQTSLVLGGVALVFLIAAVWLSIRAMRHRSEPNSGGGG